jgi:biotin synthase-like enzyme
VTWLDTLAAKAIAKQPLTRDGALKVLATTDDELLDVVAAAFRVRLRYFGRRVKLNYLVNVKSGLCPEDIAGMGESDEQLAQVVFALRELAPDSVPVNFLIPVPGTPLVGRWDLTPRRCLRILAMVRFICPGAEVRVAGGREVHLRSLQPLALHIANSIFLGDYLTTEGQPGARDLQMIADAGFTAEGMPPPQQPSDLVRIRRRGPGTALPANA